MSKNKRELLAGYVDGELSDSEKVEFEKELQVDPELKAELDEFMKLKSITSQLQYDDLPDEVWDNYWESLYKKTERGLGWIFLSVGSIVLICYGLYHFFNQLLFDPNVAMLVKICVPVATVGVVILFVSFLRERLFARKRDRYRKVRK